MLMFINVIFKKLTSKTYILIFLKIFVQLIEIKKIKFKKSY